MKWKSTPGYFHPDKASIVEGLIKDNVTSETNCVEIGVLCGKSLMHLVEHSNPNHVYAIDPFEGQQTQELTLDGILMVEVDFSKTYDYDKVLKKFDDYKNVSVIKGYSPMYDLDLPDIGFAFIDGDHSKESVSKDAEWIYSKMSKGLIVFDDYALEGVADAVEEFAEKYSLNVHKSNPPSVQTTIAWIFIEKT